MAIEVMIVQAVKRVRADMDVFHDFAPDNAAVPFVVISRVGGEGNLYLDHQTDGGYHVRMQVSVWAEERLESVNISRQIENELNLLQGVRAVSAALSAVDPDVGWFGMHQDFYVVS